MQGVGCCWLGCSCKASFEVILGGVRKSADSNPWRGCKSDGFGSGALVSDPGKKSEFENSEFADSLEGEADRSGARRQCLGGSICI